MNAWLNLKSGSAIRGYVEDRGGDGMPLTRAVAEKIGYAFALWLSAKLARKTETLTLAVGRDPRPSSEILAAGFIHGLTSADADVFDCGLSSTPAMFMTTDFPETRCDGAVMVTASSRSADMNGFKLMTREGSLRAPEIEEVLTLASDAKIPHRLVTAIDFLSLYEERLKTLVRERLEDDVQCPLLGLHVVVDASNGSGGFYADLLEALGAEVTGSLNLLPDGRFPNHSPDPGDPDALAALSDAVVRAEADLGVLFDADCDRVVIVDEKGRAIAQNRLIALVSAILLEKTPGATIVTDSVTSSGLQRFINEWGGVHYRYKRGYKNVIDEARRLNEEGIDCPLAIETSGHAAFRENYFLDDGMYLATRLICEALERKRAGQTLADLLEGLQEPVEALEIRLPLRAENYRAAAQNVIETILSHTLEDPAWRLATDNREGVRIFFNLAGGIDNAWFLLRLSVHDPVMPLHCESSVPGGVRFMLEQLDALLQDDEALALEPLKQALRA